MVVPEWWREAGLQTREGSERGRSTFLSFLPSYFLRPDTDFLPSQFNLPDTIPGHLLTPFTWGPVESYDPHPSNNDASFNSVEPPALVSSLASPLSISSSSKYHHFLKVIGKQSVGDITFVSGEKDEKDLVVSVRAIWREEDEEWGVEELERVEGGIIEDEDEGALGVGILVSYTVLSFSSLVFSWPGGVCVRERTELTYSTTRRSRLSVSSRLNRLTLEVQPSLDTLTITIERERRGRAAFASRSSSRFLPSSKGRASRSSVVFSL